VRESTFKMAEIADVPKEYTIGLVVGPSGSGKTLLIQGRFGYEVPKDDWKDNFAVISQVHPEIDEAYSRLLDMGICSPNDMCRPFKDLSVGQQDLVRMARALGHGAVFDEFGSRLGPMGLFRLCRAVRRAVLRRGLGNVVVATCNPQVAQLLKPDWTITTGSGAARGQFRLKTHPEGYWGEDLPHKVDALHAVSSRLLRSSAGKRSTGKETWSQGEVAQLAVDFRLWEKGRYSATSRGARRHVGKDGNAGKEEDCLGKVAGDEGAGAARGQDSKRCAPAAGCSEGEGASSQGFRGGETSVSRRPSDAEMAAHSESRDRGKSVDGGAVNPEEHRRTMLEGEGEAPWPAVGYAHDDAADEAGEQESDNESNDGDRHGASCLGAQKLFNLETLLKREMQPNKSVTRLRIRLESADKDVWPLFKEAHYLGDKPINVNAHWYVATLPDHGSQIVGTVSAIPRPGRGNGIKTRTHRGHWREYRLVVLAEFQGCGIG